MYNKYKKENLGLVRGDWMQLVEYIIGVEYKVVDALAQINKNRKGIVYVCSNGLLCGSVTDGDIRRHILNKGSLEADITEIMNRQPVFSYFSEKEFVQDVMLQNQIRSIPILDEEKRILDICFINEKNSSQKKQLDIPVVIMAGGKGTRLYPYTQILPKPLIPIGEKTITEHIISRFHEYGCEHFDMIVNYKKNFIKSYFLDNENTYDVNFIDETEFLGTGGGLRLLKGRYKTPFFMTNCDILIEEDYAKIFDYHQKNKNIITMVCAEKNMIIPYGTVEVSKDGQAMGLKEKPSLSFTTNTGFYVIEPEFLELIPDNTFIHITDVIQKCIDMEKGVGVYTISEEKWLDMGQMEELEKMKKKLNL